MSSTTMADKENCVRVTRAATKRASSAMADEQVSTKKRVVLGELPHLSNAAVQENRSSGIEPQKQKWGKKTKAKKALPMTTMVKTTQDTDTKLDDPQLCGPYVSDVYDYLHELEVMGFLLLVLFCFLVMELFLLVFFRLKLKLLSIEHFVTYFSIGLWLPRN